MNFWERTIRNHGLEHGTISILMSQQNASGPLAGYSIPSGFFIVGNVSLGETKSAADAALREFQKGRTSLAISPFCGTNILTSALLTTITSLATFKLSGGGLRGFSRSVSNAALALVLSQPLGKNLQKKFTTSPNMNEIFIEKIKKYEVGPTKIYWIKTGSY